MLRLNIHRQLGEHRVSDVLHDVVPSRPRDRAMAKRMQTQMPADIDALNYPYIRIRSVEWLKRTLLIFPHVVRMTPDSSVAPGDDPEVSEFSIWQGTRGPLLRAADLTAPHVQDAQRQLIGELKRLIEGNELNSEQFSHAAVSRKDGGQTGSDLTLWERRLSDLPSFQIHRYKMNDELTNFLVNEHLAWEPNSNFSDGPLYLEMHPRLGEAVMATLAFACAENEGLQIVTEFPKIYGKVIGQRKERILSACLQGPPASGMTSSQHVAEFLVYRRCDVSKLTPQRIAALRAEGDALADFRSRLEELVTTLPPTIYSEKALEERLNDLLNDIFRKWQNDQANFSSYARQLFGKGALKEPNKLIQKLIETAVAPAAGAVTGAHIGSLTIGIASGALAGFAVALIFWASNAWIDIKNTEQKSPFRYLTTLADNGVAFRLSQ
jgi:hypothetical protein